VKLKILAVAALGTAALLAALPTLASAEPRARLIVCDTIKAAEGHHQRHPGKRGWEELQTRECAWVRIPTSEMTKTSHRVSLCMDRHEDEAEGAKLARRCLKVAVPPGTPVHAYRPGHAQNEEQGGEATASHR
jgi:hypothetical protein